jgi:hypothetical protein
MIQLSKRERMKRRRRRNSFAKSAIRAEARGLVGDASDALCWWAEVARLDREIADGK